jgi:small-conductance mechanosensitive channel
VLGGDLRIGKVTISPMAIAGGLATLLVGVGLAHLARAWVERRYLPVTHWDAGLRNSVATGISYLGVIIAIVCALAVTGVGLTQLALVASALSVGIGFGLQQIVQNFVAGVILLIERPVKVGDWVSVGSVEGDVLDIRVRATDIRSLDGSTVIVPNSTLITTNVENKTVGHAPTRIQLQVTIVKAADVPKAREAILRLAGSKREVMQDPAPEVFIDALTAGGGATLEVWLHIADPRAARRIRSDLYLALLETLQSHEIAL